MNKIFKLKNTLLFNREDVESYYTDNELDQYNIKLVVNMNQEILLRHILMLPILINSTKNGPNG